MLNVFLLLCMFCSVYSVCVVLCIVYVQMCSVPLPPAGSPTAVNKYIISYKATRLTEISVV
jgi:hypothetical protein